MAFGAFRMGQVDEIELVIAEIGVIRAQGCASLLKDESLGKAGRRRNEESG